MVHFRHFHSDQLSLSEKGLGIDWEERTMTIIFPGSKKRGKLGKRLRKAYKNEGYSYGKRLENSTSSTGND